MEHEFFPQDLFCNTSKAEETVHRKRRKILKSFPLTERSHKNHEIFEVTRDLWRSSGSTPVSKQDHPEPLTQVQVQDLTLLVQVHEVIVSLS